MHDSFYVHARVPDSGESVDSSTVRVAADASDARFCEMACQLMRRAKAPDAQYGSYLQALCRGFR